MSRKDVLFDSPFGVVKIWAPDRQFSLIRAMKSIHCQRRSKLWLLNRGLEVTYKGKSSE